MAQHMQTNVHNTSHQNTKGQKLIIISVEAENSQHKLGVQRVICLSLRMIFHWEGSESEHSVYFHFHYHNLEYI